MSELNRFLQDLEAEGIQDSSGIFTVAVGSSREKLGKFRLLDPHLFVLNVVSAAVLGKATYLDINHTNESMEISFDGRRYSQTDLHQMYVSNDLALQELAVAIEGASLLSPQGVKFLSEGGLTIDTDQREIGNGIPELNVLTLSPTSKASLLSRVFKETAEPAWRSALGACRFAPLRLSINQKRLNLKRIPAITRTLFLTSETAAVPVRQSTWPVIHTAVASGPYQAVLGFPPGIDMDDVTIVNRGVSFSREKSEFKLGHLGGVITTNLLRKNLSHSDLVEDSDYSNLRDTIWNDVLEAVRHFDFDETWSGDVTGWPEIVLAAAARLLAKNQTEEAITLRVWAGAHLESPHLDILCDGLSPEQKIEFSRRYLRLRRDRESVPNWAALIKGTMKAAGLGSKLGAFASLLGESEKLDWVEALALSKDWDVIAAILQSSDSTEGYQRVADRLEHPQTADPTTILIAQSVVCERLHLNFEEKALPLFDSGALQFNNYIRDWLKLCGHTKLVKRLQKRKEANQPSELLDKARSQLEKLTTGGRSSLGHIRQTLREAYAAAQTIAQPDTVVELGICRFAFGDQTVKNLEDGSPWTRHRLGCIKLIRGDVDAARQLHQSAHSELKDDPNGWSALLMGDLHRACGSTREAQAFYTEANEAMSHCYQQEALANILDGDRASELWKKIAAATQGAARCLALEAATKLTRASSFLSYIRLRADASLAWSDLDRSDQNMIGRIDRRFSRDDFIELALLKPDIAIHHIHRRVRTQSAELLANFRLLQMLDLTEPGLTWKAQVRDS
jgi:hypothetical protein